MLSAATGIDHVLPVVAADDGPMPQTREHPAILDLLGLSRAVVALTKCDPVSKARLAQARAEIRLRTRRTAAPHRRRRSRIGGVARTRPPPPRRRSLLLARRRRCRGHRHSRVGPGGTERQVAGRAQRQARARPACAEPRSQRGPCRPTPGAEPGRRGKERDRARRLDRGRVQPGRAELAARAPRDHATGRGEPGRNSRFFLTCLDGYAQAPYDDVYCRRATDRSSDRTVVAG